MSVEDLRELTADRPGWTAQDASVATYQPTDGGWSAVVRASQVAGHTYWRWNVAVIDSAHTARFVRVAVTAAEAVRIAERSVR